ncbi:MAG: ABC transporter substrate-binding protein [Thaumarchaeota archaeon]|nr:ABC transporter substrate-binding protein [Nitrososphaerota archaeon]
MRKAALLLLLLIVFSTFSAAAAGNSGITVVDDFGRRINIPKEPRRIVSLAPSVTETLFAIGLGDRVVGVTAQCNYPPEVLEKVGAGEITVVGEFVNPSLEKVVALQPDLVIGHNLLSPDFVRKLDELGIPVVVLNTPKSVEGVYHSIRLIGRACWADEKAESLIKNLNDAITFWEQRLKGVEKVEAAEIAWVNPIYVAGNGTYIGDVIERAGGRNAFSDKNWWASISEEELVERDPPHLIVPYEHGQEMIYQEVMELKKKGLIHGEIHLIDPDILSRPGPRLAIFFEEVVKALHPTLWRETVEVDQLIAPSRAIVGDLLTVYVKVKNPGLVAGEKTVKLEINGSEYSETIQFNPGESKLLNFTFTAEKKGVYIVKAGSLSTIIKVSPTAEEMLEEARNSFAKLAQEYLAQNLSPLSSKVDSLANKVGELEKKVGDVSASTSSQLSEASKDIVELRGELERLKETVTLLLILSVIAVIAAVSSAIYIAIKAGEKG